MKERKCKKCKLTYKGLKERCPFCHKLTKLGVLNRIMCILGYITLLSIITTLVYYIVAMATISTILAIPTIAAIIVIALIIGIIIAVLK